MDALVKKRGRTKIVPLHRHQQRTILLYLQVIDIRGRIREESRTNDVCRAIHLDTVYLIGTVHPVMPFYTRLLPAFQTCHDKVNQRTVSLILCA